MSNCVICSGDRAAFLVGLRELIDSLTADPTDVVPRRAPSTVVVDASDAACRDGAEVVVAPLGVPVENAGRSRFDACRDLGPIAYGVVGTPPEERQ